MLSFIIKPMKEGKMSTLSPFNPSYFFHLFSVRGLIVGKGYEVIFT